MGYSKNRPFVKVDVTGEVDKRFDEVTSRLADIATLKPNGVDDTENLQACNGKTINLASGTFIVRELTFGINTHLRGKGIDKTIIKLKDNSNSSIVVFKNAQSSSIKELTIDGNRANNTETSLDSFVSGLLILSTISNNKSKWCEYKSFKVVNCANNNISILTNKDSSLYGVTLYPVWTYLMSDFFSFHCDGYCFYDSSSDNHYSDFYLSGGGKAAMMLRANSNMYSNFKVDGQSGNAYPLITDTTAGANVIISKCSNIMFNNIDCQSSQHVGLKIFGGSYIQIFGSFDSNGWGQLSKEVNNGTGIYMGDHCRYVSGVVHFFRVQPDLQPTDLYIGPSCINVSLLSTTIDRNKIYINAEGCNITNFSEIIDNGNSTDDSIKGFVSAYSKGEIALQGYIDATERGIVADNLKLWLIGNEFPTTNYRGSYSSSTSYVIGDGVKYNGYNYESIQNSSNVIPTNINFWKNIYWLDKSGNGNELALKEFTFDASSGKNGSNVNLQYRASGKDDRLISLDTSNSGELVFSNEMTIELTMTVSDNLDPYARIINNALNQTLSNFFALTHLANSFYPILSNSVGTYYTFPDRRAYYALNQETTLTYVLKRVGKYILVAQYLNGIFNDDFGFRDYEEVPITDIFIGDGQLSIYAPPNTNKDIKSSLALKEFKFYTKALTTKEIYSNYLNRY